MASLPRSDHPLAAVLRSVGPQSCPGEINLHCHTLASDGSLEPLALADQAVRHGLRHLAVTDHHGVSAHAAIEGHFEALKQRGQSTPRLWSGVEISCLLEGCLVHVLVLGFTMPREGELHPLSPYLQGRAVVGADLRSEAVVRAAHAAGGLALLAHPARYRLPHARLIAAAAAQGFDGAEAWYDYDLRPRWAPTPVVCEAIAADLRKRGLVQSCGTDTHGFSLRGR
ncbi:MAG: PHP domain-containing protein [Cyanobacteriota bacterium]